MDRRYVIASDLDGTLLNEEHRLSARIVKQLKHVRDQGHVIVAVTGRSHLSAVNVLEQTDTIDTIICSNGAYRYAIASGTVSHEKKISHENWSRWITDLRQSVHDVCFAWESTDGVFYDATFLELAGAPVTLQHLERVEPDVSDELLKLLIRSDCVNEDVLQTLVQSAVGTDGEVSSSGAPFIEATASGSNKGNALAQFCNELGIGAENTIAFGDNYNDESMIRWAVNSYAMNNAVDRIKQLARYQALSNIDDGVAVALEAMFQP